MKLKRGIAEKEKMYEKKKIEKKNEKKDIKKSLNEFVEWIYSLNELYKNENEGK